jgi:hypothetical protein
MSDPKNIQSPVTKEDPAKTDWLEVVKQHVRSLKFGTVLITIHDSRVVQIERLEKVRFDKQ